MPVTENQVGDASTSVGSGDISHGVLFNNTPKGKNLKVTEAEFIQKCKEFMTYTLTDENMAYYTETTGIEKPLNYPMTDAQLEKLTPFQKNTREMLADTTHIKPAILSQNVNPIHAYGGISNVATEAMTGISSVPYDSIYSFFSGVGNTDPQNYYLSVRAKILNDFDTAKRLVDEYLNG